ncbi:MAG: GxxExxY protein [Pelolinea sp.]|nr:GxxExxY protein [Pelolinea sp.]
MSDNLNLSIEQINSITEKIIGCAFQVSNKLGVGFLERVYENALIHELTIAGLKVERQIPLKVHYDGVIVGDYAADLLVEKCILVELKTASNLEGIHLAQCMNYLKATGLKICLLLKFGTIKVQIKRIINQ